MQEAEGKMTALADLQLNWHFIGPIQSNKTTGRVFADKMANLSPESNYFIFHFIPLNSNSPLLKELDTVATAAESIRLAKISPILACR